VFSVLSVVKRLGSISTTEVTEDMERRKGVGTGWIRAFISVFSVLSVVKGLGSISTTGHRAHGEEELGIAVS